MSLHPSQSPSPGPGENGRNATSRQSLGPSPSARGTPLAPGSPRMGPGARPTSELLGSAGMFQTPEAEALDQWFENLQSYEATLEEMAAASLDVNFKEELSAIEQWFKVLSEAERTAALYSLLQHSTQVQIRFFITVLQQMARSDPMTAMLSPALGGSMQAQMDAKLAGLKSPGMKSGLPASPTTRNFGNRQSLGPDSPGAFLSPDSANNLAAAAAGGPDAASTLAQQRAKLKASNASHRISAPVLSSPGGHGAWGTGSGSLGQVAEQSSGGSQDAPSGSNRPKSTEFTGGGSPRPVENPNNEATLPARDSWASMVNTPLIPMFQKQQNPQTLESAANKLAEWQNKSPTPGVPRMGDPTIHRRRNAGNDNDNHHNRGGGFRNAGGSSGPGGWQGSRSPPQNNTRFGGGDDNSQMGMNGLGMNMGGFNPMNMNLGSPPMGMPGMGQMNPFNMQMLSAMGISPEAQLLAAQMAASGFGQQGGGGGGSGGFFLPPNSALSSGGRSRGGGPGPRSAGLKSSSSVGSSAPKGEEDVDPALLNDIPSWLRTLRLHKYTPNFEGIKWQDMVLMDDAGLEARGVAALGARRKMLKTFEVVRKKMGIEGGPPPSGIP